MSNEALVPDQNPLRPQRLPWDDYEAAATREWQRLLTEAPTERQVQEFLMLHPAFVPGGSGDIGPGGHHHSEMSGLFAQPTLKGVGRSFIPDFMWVTRSTSLITPILIEIEDPSKRWFTAHGRPTANLTHAHDQLNDWRSWFAQDENRAIFRKNFLFLESYSDRSIEPQYVLIYGRASEFEHAGGHSDPDSLRHKRDTMRLADESFITFDSLRPRFDHSDSLTLKMTSTGPRPWAVSPRFTTGSDTGADAILLGDLGPALARSALISSGRKQYLLERWQYWAEVEQNLDGRFLRQGGRE